MSIFRFYEFYNFSNILRFFRSDRIYRSDRILSAVDNSRSFLLFRGATLKEAWIKDWKAEVGNNVCLPGNTSTSEIIDVALRFARPNQADDIPVLFVYYVWNFINYSGFRLNDERYSAFPDECEHLLPEGQQVCVEGFEEIEIKNSIYNIYENPEIPCKI